MKNKNPLYEFKVGVIYGLRDGSEMRIMAEAEGYYMARFKGCAPFVETGKDLFERICAINQEHQSPRVESLTKTMENDNNYFG